MVGMNGLWTIHTKSWHDNLYDTRFFKTITLCAKKKILIRKSSVWKVVWLHRDDGDIREESSGWLTDALTDLVSH